MRAKIISSLEKCFLDETVFSKPQLKEFSMLKNEKYSFQMCFDTEHVPYCRDIFTYEINSPLKDYISVYKVQNIPSNLPVCPNGYDEKYLRTEPGLYPDLLQPTDENDHFTIKHNLLALWFEIDTKGQVEAGTYPIKITLKEVKDKEPKTLELTVTAEIINAELPKLDLYHSRWFYPDCLAQYYNVEMYSERHWQIIENFLMNAVKYGQNTVLTPIISPELDTYVGGYRPSTQLVGITLENGKYSFDFSKLNRWVDLCDKVGIKYFEIGHFFTQWGFTACPQVYVNVNGEEVRMFDWDTPVDDKYIEFLTALVPAVLDFMKTKNGADKRCFFHISDEPAKEHLEEYKKFSEKIKPLFKGLPVMDALSDYCFYESGAVDIPITAIDHIEPFIEKKVDNLFAYYCSAQHKEVSNCFFSMPSPRTRIIGAQLYKYDIKGFLTWGYNFYNSQLSYSQINPFICSDSESAFPSGDAYIVYPGTNGIPWPSLRQLVFYDALQDIMALKLCEKLYNRDFVMNLIEDGIEPLTFKQYPCRADYILNLREKVNKAIKEKI